MSYGNRSSIEVGAAFGRRVVLTPAARGAAGLATHLTLCSCGTVQEVAGTLLRRRLSDSCGCASSERMTRVNLKHGAAHSPTWMSWKAMRDRCTRRSMNSYEHYGGRGIRVCERWQFFANFLEDMGKRPDGTTLDRIDVDGHYEPGNCRWATSDVQARNKRR